MVEQMVAYSVNYAGLENGDRKSTRLNSSHFVISYAVFCLKKKSTRLNSSHLVISSAAFSLQTKTGIIPSTTPRRQYETPTLPSTAALTTATPQSRTPTRAQ